MQTGKPSESAAPRVEFDAVCRQIRAAIEPARAHAVSLHDRRGDLLWLSESTMGPDEHDAVRLAFEVFANPASPALWTHELGDGRAAVVFQVANAQRALLGAAMAIVDARIVKQDADGAASLTTPKLLGALADFAAMLCPAQAPAPAPAPPSGRRDGGAGGAGGADVSPAIDRLQAALRRSPLALYVQRLVPLTKGGKFKRYEVLLRFKSAAAPNSTPHAMLKAAVDHGLGSMIDRRVVGELIAWLTHHPQVWQDDGAQFSVNLTDTALRDEHFIKFVAQCLGKASLPNGTIAFEIDVPSAVALGADLPTVAAGLQRHGCPLVLDNFALRTECFDLLRIPSVQLIKLAPAITAQMRADKLAQAAITALVQMARVLGMHTVAKHSDSAQERQWLTTLGVDFIQSKMLAPPVPIESLALADPG